MTEQLSSKARIFSLFFVVVVVLGAVGAAIHLKNAKQQPAQRKVTQEVARVVAPPLEVVRDYQIRLRGNGSARPAVSNKIIPQVGGKIIELGENFQAGAEVTKGELLIQIDPTDARQAVASATAQEKLYRAQLDRLETEKQNLQAQQEIEQQRMEIARQQLDRLIQLQKENAATENDVDRQTEQWLMRRSSLRNIANQLALIPEQQKQLQAQILAVRTELEKAGTMLERTTILSPITGRVVYSNVEAEDVVAPNQVVGEIFQPRIMEIPVSVSAAEMKWIPDDWVSACQANGDGIPDDKKIRAEVMWTPEGETIDRPIVWKGCVIRISAGLDDQTRLLPMIVQVDNQAEANQDAARSLKPNKFVEVVISGRKLPKVFVLPRPAVLAPDEQYETETVWVVVDGKLRRRPIDVLRYVGETALVLPESAPGAESGLAAGDRVVTNEMPLPVVGMDVKVYSSQDEMNKTVAGAAGQKPDAAVGAGQEG